jgi:hypothetical protein
VPVIQEKIVKKPASGRATIIKVYPFANQITAVRHIKAVFQTINVAVLNIVFHGPDRWVIYQIAYAIQIVYVSGGVRLSS